MVVFSSQIACFRPEIKPAYTCRTFSSHLYRSEQTWNVRFHTSRLSPTVHVPNLGKEEFEYSFSYMTLWALFHILWDFSGRITWEAKLWNVSKLLANFGDILRIVPRSTCSAEGLYRWKMDKAQTSNCTSSNSLQSNTYRVGIDTIWLKPKESFK